MAFSLFLIWERSSCIDTTTPVGICVKRTADIVVLTDCPPAPLDAKVSTRISFSLISISISSASGRTTTVAVEVWIRPLDSVVGTRWTRCAPLSNFILEYTSSPEIIKIASLIPPIPVSERSNTSTFHPWDSANLVYMRRRSPANNCASSPPAAPRTSTTTFLPSFGSFGNNKIFNSSSIGARLGSNSLISSCIISFISLSSSISSSSFVSAICWTIFLYSLNTATVFSIERCSFEYSISFFVSLTTSGSLNSSLSFS